MSEHRYIIYKGMEYGLLGSSLEIAEMVPDFDLVAYFKRGDTSMDYLSRERLLSYGYPVIISVITSVDTPIGRIQTKQFNEKLRPYVDDAVLMSVSSDLPFNIVRFFEDEGIDNLLGCSDYKDRSFGSALGLLIEDPMFLCRAVLVIDKYGRLAHFELVQEISNEPDYESAINVLQRLIESY